jgi:hypothetical protein
MLALISVGVVLLVAYMSLREGLLTAACTLFNVLFAGLIAFWCFEPLANGLEDYLRGTFLEGTEDAFALSLIFAAVFALLKVVTGKWSGTVIDYPLVLDRVVSGILGALAGYFLAGFLVCMYHTLPWGAASGPEYRVEPNSAGAALRRILPPDRVWLAMMNRASEVPFLRSSEHTFDEDGSFSLRYARHRRKAP